MIINISNVEKLIFWNSEIENKFGDLQGIFMQYKLGIRNPSLKNMSKVAVPKLLEALTEEHITILKNYYGEEVTVEKFDNHLIYDYCFDKDEVENKLEEVKTTVNCFLSRSRDKVYIGFWR